MEKLITLKVFDNSFEVTFNLLKDMLDEAGIPYLASNVNSRSLKPSPSIIQTNLAIEIKVYEKDMEEAYEILRSIK